MDDVGAVLDQMLAAGPAPTMSREERKARARAIARLFRAYGSSDMARAELYLDETAEIPAWWLGVAIRGVIRTRVYPSLPAVAELWALARKAAGMDRAQYRAGHYLPPPREWPPPQRRHAVTAGDLEALGGGSAPLLAEAVE